MALDFTADIATIVDDWETRVTLKRNTPSYNDRGEEINIAWDTVVTADVNIQPAGEKLLAQMEESGVKEKYTHVVFGYYDTTGTKISAFPNDRLYDPDDKIYEIKQVKEYENSHIEMYCVFVEGKA